jgi:hypothetical protein
MKRQKNWESVLFSDQLMTLSQLNVKITPYAVMSKTKDKRVPVRAIKAKGRVAV